MLIGHLSGFFNNEWKLLILDFCKIFLLTVGAIFFENQNACLKSPRMHQSSKSLWPSSRVGPEVSKTPPTCKVWMILSQVIAIGRKLKFSKIGLIFDFEKQCVSHFVFGCFISQILCKLCKLGVFWNPQDLL